jgi:hypothetical protein
MTGFQQMELLAKSSGTADTVAVTSNPAIWNRFHESASDDIDGKFFIGDKKTICNNFINGILKPYKVIMPLYI